MTGPESDPNGSISTVVTSAALLVRHKTQQSSLPALPLVRATARVSTALKDPGFSPHELICATFLLAVRFPRYNLFPWAPPLNQRDPNTGHTLTLRGLAQTPR